MSQPLDELATDMFRTFARFEFALKAAGFHNGDGAAEPNWRSFAQTIPALFKSSGDPDLKAAVDFILDHPPRKQIIANGVLTWGDSTPDTDLLSDRVLIYVRRVRKTCFTVASSTAIGSSRREVSSFFATHSSFCAPVSMLQMILGRHSTTNAPPTTSRSAPAVD